MNADRWAVQSTHGVSALGTYGFAMHFSSVGLVLLNMVQLYVSPRLLRRFGADGDTTALRRHSVRFAIFTAGTYAVTAVPLVFAFPRLLARYFPAYMGAAPLAPWVAIGTGAIALGFFDVLFRASGNGRPLALVQVIVAIVGFAAALVASALDSPLWVFALGFCCTRIVSTILGWVTGSRLLLQQTSTSPTSKT
jgi:O-antigen/teichoic acid export membrane protein